MADAPDRRKVGSIAEEKRTTPAQKHQLIISRRRSMTLSSWDYDATTEFMKQVDRAIINRARRSKTVLKKTMSRTSLLKHYCWDYRGVDDCVRCVITLRTATVVDSQRCASTTESTGFYSSGIDTGSYRGYLLNVALIR